MKTKIFGILTAAAMTFSLFGCDSKDDDDDKSVRSEKTVVENMLNEYDSGFYRAERTFYTNANVAGYLGLDGMDVSAPSASDNTARALEAMGYTSRCGDNDDKLDDGKLFSYYKGNPVADSLLGIKYFVDRHATIDAARRIFPHYEDTGLSYNYTDSDDNEQILNVYQNPYALSMGYMGDKTVEKISALGNDNPFESLNIYMSTIAGQTMIDNGSFQKYNKYFVPLNADPNDFILNNVNRTTAFNDQIQFNAEPGDPTVDMHIVPMMDGPVYIHFQTEYQNQVNLWVSTNKLENGQYMEHHFISTYFDDYNYCILNIGDDFKAGQEFELRMTVASEYAIVKNFHFYQFDSKLFRQDIDKLKGQQWDITSVTGKSIEGTITAGEDQLMVTSIPYDEKWTVMVDGEEMDFCDKDTDEFDSTEQCWTKIIEEFIAVKLTPGEHTVRMTYNGKGGASLRLFTYN